MKVFIFLFSIFLWVVPLSAKDPEIFYLTWAQDPSSSMVVHWHTKGKPSSSLFFQKEGSSKWYQQQPQASLLKGSKIFINSVQLHQLKADTRYFIQFEKKGQRYYFRTLPQDVSRPIRFAVGGDLFLNMRAFKRMSRQVISTDPDFIVLGGDLAYAENPKALFETKKRIIAQWNSFFRHLKNGTVTADKRIIPILPIIGNHDITKVERKEKGALFFLQFFPYFKSYRTVELSPDICLFLLDTGHLERVGGKQLYWLEEAFKRHEEVRYKIPLYHVAAFPSCYSANNRRALEIREHWSPLFEKYKVKFAFEHHNHAYKRTFPIKENKIDPEGVVYLGDGSWGVTPREVQDHWYLEKAAKLNCFWLVMFDGTECHLQSFGVHGNLIDDIKL